MSRFCLKQSCAGQKHQFSFGGKSAGSGYGKFQRFWWQQTVERTVNPQALTKASSCFVKYLSSVAQLFLQAPQRMLKHFCVLGELRQNMSFTAASLSPTSDFFQRKPHAPFYLPSDSSCQQEVKSSRSTRLLSVPVNEQFCICITDDTPIHLSYSCLTFQSPLIHEKDTELPKVFHL